MIATQCPSDNKQWNTSLSSNGKGDSPITIVEEILDAVIEEYPIDTNKFQYIRSLFRWKCGVEFCRKTSATFRVNGGLFFVTVR
jgi:hypothetical protein